MEPNEIIRRRRQEKRLTLEQVADFVGVSKNTISKYERGIITNIRRDKIHKLAIVLDVSPILLINGSNDKKTLNEDEFKMELNELLERLEIQKEKKEIITNFIGVVLSE